MNVYSTGEVGGLDLIRAVSPEQYAHAEPFPHMTVQGVFADELLNEVLSEFPKTDEMTQQFNAPEEVKSAEARWERFGPTTQLLLANLNSAPFVDALEQVTGMSGLITDHHFRGGGQHQIRAGGLLGIHADFNRHEQLKLTRRLNVIVYLNHDWDDAWGGQLELWDRQMTEARASITPSFNTMAVFTTDTDAFHGHPDALSCPPGVTRRSIATYYYVAAPSTETESTPHTTLFQDRPGVPPRTTRFKKAMKSYRHSANYFRTGTRELIPDEVVSKVKGLTKRSS